MGRVPLGRWPDASKASGIFALIAAKNTYALRHGNKKQRRQPWGCAKKYTGSTPYASRFLLLQYCLVSTDSERRISTSCLPASSASLRMVQPPVHRNTAASSYKSTCCWGMLQLLLLAVAMTTTTTAFWYVRLTGGCVSMGTSDDGDDAEAQIDAAAPPVNSSQVVQCFPDSRAAAIAFRACAGRVHARAISGATTTRRQSAVPYLT